MIILRPKEMKEMDKETIDSGFPGLLLMDTAGRGVAETAVEYLEEGGKITVFCGKGHNGGDGFVAARFLHMWDYRVRIILMGRKDDLAGEPEINCKICQLRGIEIIEYDQSNEGFVKNYIENSDLIIDALLGTGLKGNVRGEYFAIIEMINNFSGPILAVDIPSGLDGKKGTVLGIAVKADVTVTMAFAKLGLCIYPGREYTGRLEIVDLGMPEQCINKVSFNHFMLTEKEAADILPLRPVNGHKGTFGKIGVIGGSPGMVGAPVLTGISALKTGCGLVKLAVPGKIQQLVHSYHHELLTTVLPEDKNDDFLKVVEELNDFSDVLAAGPGLGRSEQSSEIIKYLLTKCKLPLILDADGLNVIDDLDLLYKFENELILTPHPGEMARLTGRSIEEINNNRIKIARDFATKYNLYLLLKGAASVIALPGGEIYINPTGNQALATAGSGDVLTGILAGLIGQGLKAERAAVLAPYLHGLTADILAQDQNPRSLLASDLITNMDSVYNYLSTL